jgi:hypothetical protein
MVLTLDNPRWSFRNPPVEIYPNAVEPNLPPPIKKPIPSNKMLEQLRKLEAAAYGDAVPYNSRVKK